MLGAKLGQRFGSRLMFRATVLIFGAAMLVMALSPTPTVMVAAQALAGLACAALVPTLVVLLANHYHGRQQAEAIGWLSSAAAIAGVLAFVLGGTLATLASWRLMFGLIAVHAAVVGWLGLRLKPDVGNHEVRIDLVGAVLAASAIILITLGFNQLRDWGLMLARTTAPFDLAGASPAPVMIVVGLAIGTAFFVWAHRRVAEGLSPLLALEVIDSPAEWAAVVVLVAVGSIEAAINFAVPLYTQIVQDQTSFQTALILMPLLLTVFFTAILIVGLYNRFTSRSIARGGLVLVTAGTAWLAFVVRNDWSTLPVIVGLIMVGLGQGALVTLLFNVLVTSSPKELSGDVGSLRGVTQNLAAAVGTAGVGALLVGLLSSIIISNVTDNPVISAELKDEVNLTNLNFFSDSQVKERLADTTATPEQVTEALHINEGARLRALKMGFLALACLAGLAIFPCSWLPDYKHDEIPSDQRL
jgi:MFS family permease